jgi:hypothetical protein
MILLQVRNPRREGVIITFKGETGNMVPIVCCQEHENSKRELYDVCETDETGEVRVIPNCQPLALLTRYRRLPCKFIAELTNRRLSLRPMHYFGKRGDSTKP